MTPNPPKQGSLFENATGFNTLTWQAVRKRAGELAVLQGHSALEVSHIEWEQAKRELLGETKTAPPLPTLTSTPDSARQTSFLVSPEGEAEAAEDLRDRERFVSEGGSDAGLAQTMSVAQLHRHED